LKVLSTQELWLVTLDLLQCRIVCGIARIALSVTTEP